MLMQITVRKSKTAMILVALNNLFRSLANDSNCVVLGGSPETARLLPMAFMRGMVGKLTEKPMI